MTSARQFPCLPICPVEAVFPVIRLLLCLVTFSGCAATVPQIDESLRRSALEGDMQAQYAIGVTYNEAGYAGWGNSEYRQEAARWFEMAASQGDVRSQYYLSQYYFNFLQDYGQSFELTKLAARQGLAEAQYSLGIHYAQAWGTEQDLVLAYKWIALANNGGIKGGSLADVDWLVWKGKMNTEQIAQGQRLAAEHEAMHGKSWSLKSVH